MSNTNNSDDNRKAVPSIEATLTETELEQVSGGYSTNRTTGRRFWVEDDYGSLSRPTQNSFRR